MTRALCMGLILLALAACDTGSESPAGGENQADVVEAPAAETPTAETATAQAGERPASFGVCASCHPVEPDKNSLGPTLFGVGGRHAGAVAGYSYSAAMKESGIVWTRETLDEYLRAPQKHVPGTKMAYPGMRDDSNRAEVIDYLLGLK